MLNLSVRGYWITCAVGFMKSRYANDIAERLVHSLPDEVRLSVARIGPVEWCPRGHHVHVMKAIAAAGSDESGASKDLMAYGEYVATSSANGLLKPFFRIASVKLFAKALPKLWERDHDDESRLEIDISKLDESRLPLRLTGIRGYDHVSMVELGWLKGIVAHLRGGDVRVSQSGWSLRYPSPGEATCEVSW